MFDVLEPLSAQDAYRRLNDKYATLIDSAGYRPILHPWDSADVLLVILYLLIDHRRSQFLRFLRVPVWLLSACYSVYTIAYCRGRSPAAAAGTGLLSAWVIVWTGTFLVFDDCQQDYARIEKGADSSVGTDVVTSGKKASPSAAMTTARDQNGAINGIINRSSVNQPHVDESRSSHKDSPQMTKYYWQSYPATGIKQRLDWTLDIFSTFRGAAWNWRISGLPGRPANIEEQISSSSSNFNAQTRAKTTYFRSFTTQSEVLRHNLYVFSRDYLILDAIKTIMAHDAYFWGFPDTKTPPIYLPASLRSSAVAVRTARLLISLGAFKFGLEFIFTLGPLFFVGILGPDRLGVRNEAWLYADQFGPLSAVLDKGLGGWWGCFWHQTFRKGFEAPATRLVNLLRLDPKSTLARLLQVFVAFGLSGFLHACGSITLLGETRPMDSMLFFLLQGVGMVLQLGCMVLLKRIGVSQRTPLQVRRWMNFGFTLIWLYHTAPLLVEDFGRGGIWLFEPVPISILRGPLRLGSNEDGWWQWGDSLFWWHTGKHWWQSGITA